MLRVSITSEALREQKGVSKTTNKPYHLTFQTAWIHTFARSGEKNPYPEKFEIILDRAEDGAPLYHPVGEYQLAPSSLYLDQRGNLAVAPRLVKIVPQAKSA